MAARDAIAPLPYAEGLYDAPHEARPVAGFGSLDLEEYRAVGVVAVAPAFSEARVAEARAGILRLVGECPPDVELQFEALAGGGAEALPPEERQDHVRKLMRFCHAESALRALRDDPGLLAAVERILGAPPEVYQEMTLLKPPGIGREKPWHQDHAYFDVPEGTPVVGVWIALDPATRENGCMVFQAGGHRRGPIPHFDRRDWQICDAEALTMDRRLACPLPAGGALLFSGLIPHGTAANRSGTRRRAVQFHYVPQGTPRIKDVRKQIFGESKFGASC